MNPVRLLFYSLSFAVCFFVGIIITLLIEAGKNQTLAGEAIVVFFGVITATLALIVAIYVAFYSSRAKLIFLNKALGIVLVIVAFLVLYRSSSFETQKEDFNESPKIHEKVEKIQWPSVSLNVPGKDTEMGIGFFKPNYYEYPSLYFKVLGIGYDFVKVIANKSTGQISYLDKNKEKFISWPEFLMTVNIVELNKKSAGNVHLKPFEEAGTIPLKFEYIKPLLVSEEWMYAKLVDGNFNEKGKGWIRCRKGNEFHIKYSLLSGLSILGGKYFLMES